MDASFARLLEPRIREALVDTPVIAVLGPRQSGKSTIVQRLPDRRYVSLDDASMRAAAAADLDGFLSGFGDDHVTIDEVHRVPGLMLAIKSQVDRLRSPGRYVVTGSANLLLQPEIGDSLAGRVEIHRLWPLSQAELLRRDWSLVDVLFEAPDSLSASHFDSGSTEAVSALVSAGGFPEPAQRIGRRRDAWFQSYVETVTERDAREIAGSVEPLQLVRVLRALAVRNGQLLNLAEVSRDLEIPRSTVDRHVATLERLFLVLRLPAWRTNVGQRLVKAPKVLVVDSGLAAWLLGASRDPGSANAWGHLLEGFVSMEIVKQLGWSDVDASAFHFRTDTGAEVDLVLEDRAGRLVGIEVKASTTIRDQDLRGLRLLRQAAGERFRSGVVLHAGTDVVPFGENLWAVPIGALWGGR